MIHIALYLTAVIAANLIIAFFGPAASVATAFALIGLTLTLRDRIHDAWDGEGLKWKMGALILAGSALSYLVNRDAGMIALASFVAFAAAETVDALVYHGLKDRPWIQRVNGSNVVSAAIDSLIFPTLAFGGLLWPIVIGQFLAKTVGGAVWSVILKPRNRTPAFALLPLALLVTPANGAAQIASAGVGVLDTPFSTEVVAELYVAAPPLLGVRPYAIASWTPWAEGDAHKPTIVTQLALPLYASQRALLTADGGFTWFPFRDYEPEPTVGARLGIFLPYRLQVFGLVASEPRNDWQRSYILGLTRNLYFRK